MSLKNFLYNEANFNKTDYINFIDILKKSAIDEKYLEDNFLKVINILAELTEIPMNVGTKLTSDSVDNFKNSLNDLESQEKLITKILALKSEIENDFMPKTISDSGINSKESFSSKKKSSNQTNITVDISGSSTDNSNNSVGAIKAESLKATNTNTDLARNSKISNNETLVKKDSEFDFPINDEPKNDSSKENLSPVKSNSKKSTNSGFNKKSEKKYYYQIHQENLSSIYDCGLICPTKYDSQRTQADIQEKYRSFLLLSDSEIIYNDDSSKQMLLELNLTSNEQPIQFGNDGLFLFDKPLPISRISRIIYSDKAYAGKLMGLVASDAISFIPDGIATYKTNIPKKSVTLVSKDGDEKLDFIEKLRFFDKRLGAFAYMKNANLYYGVYSNYSDNYFSALNELDPNFYKYNIDSQPFLKTVLNIDSNSILTHDVYSDVNINKEYLENKLKDKGNSLDKLPRGSFSINKNEYLKSIEENYKEWFYVTYLAIYGDKSASSTTSIQLKSGFVNEVKTREKADLLLALLGAYYGYKALRPHDQITINSHDELSKEIDTNTNIKFKMDSQLDYLTIETVYQKTFNNQVADKNFICLFAHKFTGDTQKINLYNTLNRNKYYECTKQTVYDVDYVRIIKKNKKTVVIESLNENYASEISQRKSLFSWIYSFFLEKRMLRISSDGIYVNKVDLITEIEKCEERDFEKLNLEWFDELVNLDIKYKR